MELDFISNYEEFEEYENIYSSLVSKTFKHLKPRIILNEKVFR